MAAYTIVFEVDLTEVNDLAYPPVNDQQTSATLAQSRSTYIPQGFHEGCENRIMKHGDQFTAYDDEAYYLKRNYVKSETNLHGVLKIITETP
jgi:hypothetical protein